MRRVAFLALTSKVPVASVSIALRAAAVRRGLTERSDAVRGAAIDMLKRWLDAFEGMSSRSSPPSAANQRRRSRVGGSRPD